MDANRRDFIKKSCALCASLIGVSIILPALNSCSTLQTVNLLPEKNSFTLAKNAFIGADKIVIIQSNSLDFSIAVVKNSETEYKAFDMQCTHLANPLIATKSGFFCNAHGSAFTLEGKPKNPPASFNLKEFAIEQNEEVLIIKV